MPKSKSSFKPIQAARRLAMQALYQQSIAPEGVAGLVAQYRDDPVAQKADLEYFETLLRGVLDSETELQAQLAACLDRDWSLVDPIERAIISIGAWELLNRLEIPYRVVINESVEQAHSFGSDESHRYVNAVLDRFSKEIRSLERSAS